MAKKIDLSRFKEFMFNHGEKVGLGACAAVALVLGVWGIWSAMGAGKPEGSSKTYAEHFKDIIGRINASITSSASPEQKADAKIDPAKLGWPAVKWDFEGTPYIYSNEALGDKRRMPKVAAISSDEKYIKWEYIPALIYAHDKARTGRTINGLYAKDAQEAVQPMPVKGKKGEPPPEIPMPPFAKLGMPKRMVVVHMRFPMKLQVELFRQALNIPTQEELFTKYREDLPAPRSLEVVRVEVLPGNKLSKPEVIMGYDEEGKFVVNAELERVFREAMFDETSPEALKEYIWQGFMTPMPKLANRKYPKFEMKDFEIDWAFLDDPENENPGAQVTPPVPLGPRGGKEMKGLPGGGLPKGLGREQPKMPMESGPVEPGTEYEVKAIVPEASFRSQNPDLALRLFGSGKDKRLTDDMNVFHVLGRRMPKPDDVANPNPMPPSSVVGPGGIGGGVGNPEAYFAAWDYRQDAGTGSTPGIASPPPPRTPSGEGKQGRPMPMTPGGSGTPASTFQPWDRDALVRFIDVDVKPGKTYRYAVRVRLANPNFERPVKELAWAGLGANKDLDPSEWTQTPEISIPEEYFLYAVDQNLLDDWDKGKTPDKNAVYKPETATSFQIHEWVPQRMDNKFAGGGVGIAGMRIIGDWVIAERQQVKRGDPIGKDLTVQTPVWDQRKDAFTIPQDRAREDKKKGVSQKGAHLDLVKGGRPAHLVDFVGGRRLNAFNKLEEDVAVDALILMPDGKLKVLNSRDASEFKDRQDRIIEMRKRIDDINANGNPNMPKGPGPGPGPGLPKKGLGGTSGS